MPRDNSNNVVDPKSSAALSIQRFWHSAMKCKMNQIIKQVYDKYIPKEAIFKFNDIDYQVVCPIGEEVLIYPALVTTTYAVNEGKEISRVDLFDRSTVEKLSGVNPYNRQRFVAKDITPFPELMEHMLGLAIQGAEKEGQRLSDNIVSEIQLRIVAAWEEKRALQADKVEEYSEGVSDIVTGILSYFKTFCEYVADKSAVDVCAALVGHDARNRLG